MTILDFFLLGIIAGLSPGPITALMLGETLKNGYKRGIQVPLAIILSNLTIAPLAISILYLGSSISSLINLVTYIGGIVLIYMGLQEWKAAGNLELKQARNPFLKALLIDLLNVHPYIFWFTILGPHVVLLLKSGSISQTFSYWALFVGPLVGLKIIFVLIADKLRPFLRPKNIHLINKILAVALIAFGIKVFFGV